MSEEMNEEEVAEHYLNEYLEDEEQKRKMNQPNKDKPDEIKTWTGADIYGLVDAWAKNQDNTMPSICPQQTFISTEDFKRVLEKLKKTLRTADNPIVMTELLIDAVINHITKKPKEG